MGLESTENHKIRRDFINKLTKYQDSFNHLPGAVGCLFSFYDHAIEELVEEKLSSGL